MAASSNNMIDALEAGGLFSKEAAFQVRAVRDRLIKQAIRKEAGLVDSFLNKMRNAPPPKGFWEGLGDKMKSGGLTSGTSGTASVAGWSDVSANLIKMLGLAGLTAGATAGAGILQRHSRTKKENADIASSYKQMFVEYPRLAEHDPHKIEMHFGIIAKFAPSLAADPIVAGSIVNSSAAMDVIDAATIKVLAETQQRVDEARDGRSPDMAQHFDRGVTIATRALNPSAKASGG